MKYLLAFLLVTVLLCSCADHHFSEAGTEKAIQHEELPLTSTQSIPQPIVNVVLEPSSSDAIIIDFPKNADYYGIHETELSHWSLFPFDDSLPLISYKKSGGQLQYAIYESGIRDVDVANELYQKYKSTSPVLPNTPDRYITYSSVYGDEDYYDGYIVYGVSSKTKGYEKSVIYRLEDNSVLCTLSLPYQKHENDDGSITENYCEIKQVAGNGLVLLLFHKTTLLSDGSFSKYYNTVSIYNAVDGSIANITGRANDPIISQDGKWLMYTSVTNIVSYDAWMPDGVFFMNLESKNVTNRDIANAEMMTVGWLDKEAFYKSIGKKPPEFKPDQILLNRITDDIPVETIPIPNDFYYGDYVAPPLVDINDFDFGEYSPIVRCYDDYDVYTHSILGKHAKSFAEGKEAMAELEDYYCGENETIAEFSDDMTDVIVKSKIISPRPNGSYNATKHILYKDGKIAAVFFNDYAGAKKLLNDNRDGSQTAYRGAGDEIYRSDTVFIRSLFNDVYVFDRNTKAPTAVYRFEGDYNSDRYNNVEDGDLLAGAPAATDAVSDICLLLEYDKYHYDSSDGCTCTQRHLPNKTLYLYNTTDKTYKLVTNHAQSYSLSPDNKYIAYSYATPSTNEQGQEVFDGGIFIFNIESGRTSMYPYTLSPTGYIHENICEIAGWTKFDIPDIPTAQKSSSSVDNLTVIYVTAPSNTPLIEAKAPEYIVNNSYIKPQTVSHKEFSWGDYLPFVKYPSYQYAKYSCLDSFAIIGEGHADLTQGEVLYNKLNNKFLKETPLPKGVILKSIERDAVINTFSRSRIIYASTDLDTVSTLAFIDKGANQPGYNSWLFRSRASMYSVYQNGQSVYSQVSEDIDVELLSTAGYYNPSNAREYVYNLNGTDYKLQLNEKSYSNVYRDESYCVFNVDNALYVYSLKKDKMLYRIKFPEPNISIKPYLTYELQQIVDEKTLLVKISNLYFNSNGEHGTKNGIYLYNIEENNYTFIAAFAHNALISPDGNYVIYTPYTQDDTRKHLSILPSSLHKEECFYIKNLTDGTTISYNVADVKSYNGSTLKYFDVPAATLEPINWIRKDKLEELIK